MSSKSLTDYHVRCILRMAELERMNIDELLDESVASLMKNVCNSFQLPHKYLLTFLLPVVGHKISGTQVVSNTEQRTNIALYSVIIGYPGANSSSGVEKIKETCLSIEHLIDIDDEHSRINSSTTVESLLSELKNIHPRIFQV
jgi:hypothetical protein